MTLNQIKSRKAGNTDTATATIVYGGKNGVKSQIIHLYGCGKIYIKEATNADTNADELNNFYKTELNRAKWVKIYDDNRKIYDTEKTIEKYFDFSDLRALRSWSVYSVGNVIAVVANFRKDYLIDIEQ